MEIFTANQSSDEPNFSEILEQAQNEAEEGFQQGMNVLIDAALFIGVLTIICFLFVIAIKSPYYFVGKKKREAGNVESQPQVEEEVSSNETLDEYGFPEWLTLIAGDPLPNFVSFEYKYELLKEYRSEFPEGSSEDLNEALDDYLANVNRHNFYNENLMIRNQRRIQYKHADGNHSLVEKASGISNEEIIKALYGTDKYKKKRVGEELRKENDKSFELKSKRVSWGFLNALEAKELYKNSSFPMSFRLHWLDPEIDLEAIGEIAKKEAVFDGIDASGAPIDLKWSPDKEDQEILDLRRCQYANSFGHETLVNNVSAVSDAVVLEALLASSHNKGFKQDVLFKLQFEVNNAEIWKERVAAVLKDRNMLKVRAVRELIPSALARLETYGGRSQSVPKWLDVDESDSIHALYLILQDTESHGFKTDVSTRREWVKHWRDNRYSRGMLFEDVSALDAFREIKRIRRQQYLMGIVEDSKVSDGDLLLDIFKATVGGYSCQLYNKRTIIKKEYNKAFADLVLKNTGKASPEDSVNKSNRTEKQIKEDKIGDDGEADKSVPFGIDTEDVAFGTGIHNDASTNDLAYKWKQAREDHKQAMKTVASYETDAWLAISYPAFNDVSVQEVSNMSKAMRKLDRLMPSSDYKEIDQAIAKNKSGSLPDKQMLEKYSDLVDDFVVAVKSAERKARVIADSNVSEKERSLLNQARGLLAHAENSGNTPEMRTNYYSKLKSIFSELNKDYEIVPVKIIGEIEEQSRGLLTTGDSSKSTLTVDSLLRDGKKETV